MKSSRFGHGADPLQHRVTALPPTCVMFTTYCFRRERNVASLKACGRDLAALRRLCPTEDFASAQVPALVHVMRVHKVYEGVPQVRLRASPLRHVDEIVRSSQSHLVKDAHDVFLAVAARDVTEHHSIAIIFEAVIFEAVLVYRRFWSCGVRKVPAGQMSIWSPRRSAF